MKSDMSEIRGREKEVRELTLAVSGRSPILFIGVYGGGATLLARRVPSILPLPSPEEMEEIKKRHEKRGLSVIGRPFRAPHHTISPEALKSEADLAWGGVLFLDEIYEFSKEALNTLYENLPSPEHLTLIINMNRCPCGQPPLSCNCPPSSVIQYRKRIFNHIEVGRFPVIIQMEERIPLTYLPPGESSENIRLRVTEALSQ